MKKLLLGLLLALSTLSGCVIETYPAYYRCPGYYYVYSYEVHSYVRVWCEPGHHRHPCHRH
jgi:hypothetical protein